MTLFSVAMPTVPQRRDLFISISSWLSGKLADGVISGLHFSADPTVSSVYNAARALRGALRDGSRWIIYMEDDVLPCEDLFGSAERWLDQNERADVLAYPLGCPYPETEGDGRAWKYPLQGFYCSVAFAIRSGWAAELVDHIDSKRGDDELLNHMDLVVAEWHRKVSDSKFLLAPAVSMVDHIGVESTLVLTRPGGHTVGRFPRFGGLGYSYHTDRKARTA